MLKKKGSGGIKNGVMQPESVSRHFIRHLLIWLHEWGCIVQREWLEISTD